MKVKKFFKKMICASLAVLVAVTAVPDYSYVEAASDDYPDEINFPIQILDFRNDGLLFEWWNNSSSLHMGLYDYFTKHGGKGKGLVEDTLGEDGTPVYTQEAVEEIAKRTQTNLGTASSAMYHKKDTLAGEGKVYHYLALKSYVKKQTSILDYYVNRAVSKDSIWLPADSSSGDASNYRLQLVPFSKTIYQSYGPYTLPSGYNEVYAEVYDDTISSTKPVYILKRDAIIFFYNVSVSKTFTLKPNTKYTLTPDTVDPTSGNGWGVQNEGLAQVQITDKDGTRSRSMRHSQTETIETGDDGKITVTISVVSGTSRRTELTDAGNDYGQRYGMWNLQLVPESGEDYPLGDYAESKAKYDVDSDGDGVSDKGWTDITTCMDYAYFVTKNFFKYHPSLNTAYNDYDTLIFHKIDDDGKTSYEFAAAEPTARIPYYDLVYNKTNKTIRNLYGSDTVDPTNGDVKKSGGAMFVVDDAVREYPDLDTTLRGDDGNQHNFHYTIASHSKFVYKEKSGQYFYFSGDDDVYVFVNRHLHLDLGGAHNQLEGEVYLDDLYDQQLAGTKDWGIVPGQPVNLDLFYMERHSTGSNFYAKMNLKLAVDTVDFDFGYDAIPYGYLVDLDYGFSVLRELNTNKNINFTDNFGNVIGADGFKLADGISLRDNKLTVTVTDKDGNADASRSREFVFADPKNPTAAEVAAVVDYFKSLEMTQGESVKITGPQYDTSVKPYDDYDDVADGKSINFVTNVTYDAWQEGASVPTEGNLTKNTPVKILIGSIKLCTASEDNEKKDLADYGLFTVERETYLESEHASGYKYVNDPSATGISERNLEKVPRGKYTLKLDPDVLTSYRVFINDQEVTELTIDFEPTYDPENNTWVYPDTKFELRAKRITPDLKDLT